MCLFDCFEASKTMPRTRCVPYRGLFRHIGNAASGYRATVALVSTDMPLSSGKRSTRRG